MKKMFSSRAIIAMLTVSAYSLAADHAAKSTDYMPSLITATPLEGRMLAFTIVRKSIGTIQRDSATKKKVRDIYADDPMMLMRAVELVNMEFKIIAEANNYWRK